MVKHITTGTTISVFIEVPTDARDFKKFWFQEGPIYSGKPCNKISYIANVPSHPNYNVTLPNTMGVITLDDYYRFRVIGTTDEDGIAIKVVEQLKFSDRDGHNIDFKYPNYCKEKKIIEHQSVWDDLVETPEESLKTIYKKLELDSNKRYVIIKR